jgi:hypothetical protein
MNALTRSPNLSAFKHPAWTEPHVRRLLFVAPSCSGQLYIAKAFWSFYGPASWVAAFAALENNPLNPWLKRSMEAYGVIMGSEEPGSVFALGAEHLAFDRILCLGGESVPGSQSAFLRTLDVLFGRETARNHWNIPDPETILGTDQQRLSTAECIRNRIEYAVAQLAQQLEETP